MLKQPMIEKLLAMRLHGMVEALKTQEQDPAARELSFLERLGPAGGSTVELARESGARAAAEERQAPHQRLCRRDRLSRRTRPGQERDPCAGARIGLGRQRTKTFSCSGQPASARASWLARWRRRRAAMVTRRSTPAPSRCSAIWRWRVPMAACAVCWPGSAASMFW